MPSAQANEITRDLADELAAKVVRAIEDQLRSGGAIAPAYLTTEEAARFLSLSKSCLLQMRKRGEGPPWVNLTGSDIRYRLRELIRWANRPSASGGAI